MAVVQDVVEHRGHCGNVAERPSVRMQISLNVDCVPGGSRFGPTGSGKVVPLGHHGCRTNLVQWGFRPC
jgi:hypothetical protein